MRRVSPSPADAAEPAGRAPSTRDPRPTAPAGPEAAAPAGKPEFDSAGLFARIGAGGVRRKAAGGASAAPAVSVPEGGGGAPLDAGTRSYFEASFGRDLGGVRVHTGAAADASARAAGAHAYTVGRDVVFRAGGYAPGSAGGRWLLAHELAHTLQPAAPAAAGGEVADDPAAEAEADRAADAAVARRPAAIGTASGARVRRKKLADIPAKDTAKLSGSSTVVDPIPAATLDEYFKLMPSGKYSASKPFPSGVTVELEGIAATSLTPMTSVARELADATYTSNATGNTVPLFGPGMTVRVNLDLSKYSLPNGDYRFTWVGTDTRGTVHIEALAAGATAAAGTATVNAPAASAPAGTATTITAGGATFTVGAGWNPGTTPNAQLDALKTAIGLVAPAALKKVDGLTFNLTTGAGSGGEDGHYDMDAHTIEMFTSAFNTNQARYGGHPWPVYAIVHEIGHAVDQTALRDAWKVYQGTSTTSQKVVDAAEKKLQEARSESGGRYVKNAGGNFDEEYPLAGAKEDFRKAATKDGVSVPKGASHLAGGPTDYANKGWQDMYAESFALYNTDPDLLSRMRPNIYAYLKKLYPR